ncbi:hypothetical protein RSAG8_12949, partial [Rhizoctonia solani AG-8 WAC10335]
MSDNTWSDHALPLHPGLPQAMPPAAQLESEILSTNIQPKTEPTDASTSVDPASIPLPSSPSNDLFHEWINFPDEEKPQQVSTLATDDLDGIPATNHDNNAHGNQETTSPNGSIPAPAAADQLDLDGGFDPERITSYADCEAILKALDDRDALHAEYLKTEDKLWDDVAEMMVVKNRVQPENEEMMVVKNRVQPENEGENHVGSNVVSPDSLHESPSACSQPLITTASQLTAIPAHITLKASVATTGLAPALTTTVIVRSQSASTTCTQPGAMEMRPNSATVPPSGSAENLSSSVVNFNGSVNTVHMSCYQASQYPTHPPQQPQSYAPVQIHHTGPANSNQPTAHGQHHSHGQARASASSRGATPSKPQARSKQPGWSNASIKPTPLKQCWTHDDLVVNDRGTASAATSGSTSQAHALVPSHSPAQLSPRPQPGFQVPGQAPYAPFQAGSTTPNQLAAISQQGTPESVQAHAAAQPQVPAQTDLYTRYHHPLNPVMPVQQSQSYPEPHVDSRVHYSTPSIQANGTVQAGYHQSLGPTPAPIQSDTPVPQGFQTTSLLQTQSYDPIQASLSGQASDFSQSIAPTRPRRTSVVFTSNFEDSSIQPPANPNFLAQTTTVPPQLSPVEVCPPVQPQAIAGPYPAAQVQGPTQRDGENEWYHVEMLGARPVRVYRTPTPEDIPPFQALTPGHSNIPSQAYTPEPVYPNIPVQPAPQQIYEAPQQAQAYATPSEPQPAHGQPRVNDQEYMCQPLPRQVQRSYSAPSAPIQVPDTLFTVTPPPPTGFKPRGDDTFSLAYWQHAPLDPGPSRTPSLGNFAPTPGYGHITYGHPPVPAPSAHSSTPGPSTLAHAHVATPFPYRSNSSLSSLSRSSSSRPFDSPAATPAPALKNTGKKRRAVVELDSDDNEIQEIPSSMYRASFSKGKRVKRGSN